MSNSIPATAEGLPKNILSLVDDTLNLISHDVYHLQVFSDLAAEVFDSLKSDAAPDRNGYVVYRLSANQVSQLDVLLNEQSRRSKLLKEKVDAAHIKIIQGGAA